MSQFLATVSMLGFASDEASALSLVSPLGGQLRRDGVEHLLDLVGRLRLVDERDHVLRGEVGRGVLQHDEVVGHDRRVGGEDVGGLDGAALERVDREGAARVERLVLLERAVVGLLQARDAVGPGLELRRPAEHQLAAVRGEIGDRLRVEAGGGLPGDDDGVLVLGRRLVEHLQRWGQGRLQRRVHGLRLGLGSVLLDELQQHPGVFGDQVERPVLQAGGSRSPGCRPAGSARPSTPWR